MTCSACMEAHLGMGGLYPVRPELLLRLRGRGEGAAGGGGAARGGRREGVRGRLHARLQQLHAHHQRPAHQLPIALQRPLRPVLVLRGRPVLSAEHQEALCSATAHGAPSQYVAVLQRPSHPESLQVRGTLCQCQRSQLTVQGSATLARYGAFPLSGSMMTSKQCAYYCASCCKVTAALSCYTVPAVRTPVITCAQDVGAVTVTMVSVHTEYCMCTQFAPSSRPSPNLRMSPHFANSFMMRCR